MNYFLKLFLILCINCTNILIINCNQTCCDETVNRTSSKGEVKQFTYHYDEDSLRVRKSDYPIHPMILARRSLYEMTGEKINDIELFTFLEAMRWAPSNYNNQPWRIVYAKRDTPRFTEFLNLLDKGNQRWAKDSSVLMIMLTNMYNKHKGNKTYLESNSFASGTAFMAMALETSARGYLIHSMVGFNKEQAMNALGIDQKSDYKIDIFIAIGKRVPPSERGRKDIKDVIRDRKPITMLISQDVFRSDWQ